MEKIAYEDIKIGDVLMTRHKYDDEHTGVRRRCSGKAKGILKLKEIHKGRHTEVKPLAYEDFVMIRLLERDRS